ncbi:MAG: hypothetical protein WAM69_15325 [Candidatus Sulfotelmatobacter sp.]
MNAVVNLPSTFGRRIHCFRLRLPAVLVWLLVLPLTPLLLLGLLVASVASKTDPFRAGAVVFRMLGALRGTQVEVQSGRVSISVGLF